MTRPANIQPKTRRMKSCTPAPARATGGWPAAYSIGGKLARATAAVGPAGLLLGGPRLILLQDGRDRPRPQRARLEAAGGAREEAEVRRRVGRRVLDLPQARNLDLRVGARVHRQLELVAWPHPHLGGIPGRRL